MSPNIATKKTDALYISRIHHWNPMQLFREFLGNCSHMVSENDHRASLQTLSQQAGHYFCKVSRQHLANMGPPGPTDYHDEIRTQILHRICPQISQNMLLGVPMPIFIKHCVPHTASYYIL